MLQPMPRIAVTGSARDFSTASSATLCLAGVFHQGTWGRLPIGFPEDVTQQRLGPLADEGQPPIRRRRKRKRIEFESLGDAQAFLSEERKKLQKLIETKHNREHSERQPKKAEESHPNPSQSIPKIISPPLPAPNAPAVSAPDEAIDSSLRQVDHSLPDKVPPVKEVGKRSNTKPLDEFAIEDISQRYASNICELRHNSRHRDQKKEQFHKAYRSYSLKKKAFRGFHVKKEKLQKRVWTIHEQWGQWNFERFKRSSPAEVEGMWDLIYDRRFTLEKINTSNYLRYAPIKISIRCFNAGSISRQA